MIDLEQKIRERAYQIWEQEGCVDGRAEQHWQMAKLELTVAGEASTDGIDTVVQPVKKTRRAAKAKVETPVLTTAPRRRRAAATLQ
jgi:hypothetical protein